MMDAPPPAVPLLVADDFPEAAALLGEVLDALVPGRFNVQTALQGRQAVTMAVAGRPAVVILDLDMPVMGGIEAAAAIRQKLAGAAPMLIGMSGNPDLVASAKAANVFDSILSKPVDFQALLV